MSDKVRAVHYRLHLEPDLRRFRFSAKTEIIAEALKPVQEISLNALELAVWSCRLHTCEGTYTCPFNVDPQKERITILFPGESRGRLHIEIDYEGRINDKMAGFYRSGYVNDGKERFIAVTQFEESDARRAFPCFDHPIHKATFEIEMVIEEELTAISNCPVLEEKPVGGGRKLVRFQKTPKMSTYLLFFGIGEFEFRKDPEDASVRVATVPGMLRQAEFGLEFGRRSLRFCEEYYGIRYPLPKLDLIAIPDFAAGAMENWGAMTFRENLLLESEETTSQAARERICEVIAHETAHQWFGNLVSPSDWKYLWLNESFATYFGFKVVDHYHPDWDLWDQFLHTQLNPAMERDGLRETVAIEIPGGEHVIINASTAPIIYNKGGAVLRQIEGYLGEEQFKEGLRHYLKKHAFDCASSRDFWEALEEVSERPVTGIMRSWVEQPGFPLIEAKREGERLLLRQMRFSYIPNESEQVWLIPITIRLYKVDGACECITFLMEQQRTSIDIGRDTSAYVINCGRLGFYRVRYLDQNNLARLGEMALRKELPAEDRWGIQNDLYAMAKRCEIPFKDYLAYLERYYSEEEAFLPVIGISDNLSEAYAILEESSRGHIAFFGRSFLERVLASIGYEPRSGERPAISLLRDHILWQAVLYGSKEAGDFALKQFSGLERGAFISPDIRKSVMQAGAFHGDEETLQWFKARLKECKNEHERINILVALGSFIKPSLIKQVQDFVLDEVAKRNQFIPICALSANPAAAPLMWEWYVSRLEVLEGFHPIHYERIIAAIVPRAGLGRKEEVEAFFNDYAAHKKTAKEAVEMSLEKLNVNSRMRSQ